MYNIKSPAGRGVVLLCFDDQRIKCALGVGVNRLVRRRGAFDAEPFGRS